MFDFEYGYIKEKVADIKKKYGYINPRRLAEDLGIEIVEYDMGRGDDCAKGFFVCKSRIPCIVINSNLADVIKQIIIAHEIGHYSLHNRKGKFMAYHSVGLFDETTQTEKEANLFAAELMLDEDEVMGYLNDDMTFFGAAQRLEVPYELLDFKFRMMKKQGFRFTAPIVADPKFLGTMEVYYNDDENHIS